MRNLLVRSARASAPLVRPLLRPGLGRYRRLRSAVASFRGAPAYTCPICEFHGAFVPGGAHLRRPRAYCPGCGSAERHRLVRAACEGMLPPHLDTLLHLAPERQLVPYFRGLSDRYVSADLESGFDVRIDLTALGLRSDSIDMIVAIHVLEHVRDDETAIAEMARVLKRDGLAVIAVPTVADATVEYARANPFEHGHVRAPGVDWYNRLRVHFGDVQLVSSDDVSEKFQTRAYEDRTRFPNEMAPERPSQHGSSHCDYVAFARL